MRQKILNVRRVSAALVLGVGMIMGFFGFLALAGSAGGRVEEPAQLIGAAVYSADGQEVGSVSAVTVQADGEIAEIRLTTSAPLGIGERTIAISQGRFIILDGAVVLELSAAEVEALPTPPVRRISTPA